MSTQIVVDGQKYYMENSDGRQIARIKEAMKSPGMITVGRCKHAESSEWGILYVSTNSSVQIFEP